MLYCEIPTPLGTMTLYAEGVALCRLSFPGEELSAGAEAGESPILREGAAWLHRYFTGEEPGELPRCEPKGTDYARRVWSLLPEIPYGGTVSYGELARRYALRWGHTSPRAVGGAVGRNPLPVFLPCHRVVGADGSLTGYAGGLAWKAWLLGLEQGKAENYENPIM